jgi:predicted  nucleic acid-binding Zn-ribbon protein
MTASDAEAMSALHELLDERQRYQAWLSTLEGRRNSTPPHVYERVQQDYVSRLDRVMHSLAEQAGQLSGTMEVMTAELAALRQHESDRADERHEAELRAAVGEFTPDDWERRRAEADGDLERIAAERHSLEQELDELQRIVALTRSIRPEMTTDSAGTPESARARMAVPESRPETQAESGPSIDEFIAEWHPPQAQAGAGGHGGGPRSHQEREIPDTADLGDEIIPAAPMGGNPVGAAGADYGIANGVTGVASGLTPTRTPPLAPAALGDSRRDADKTLKCPECGAMNYATEWYCERCGGELSTF